MTTRASSLVCALVLMALAGVLAPTRAHADAIAWGLPVTGNGSHTAAGLPVGSDHIIKYFIPLESKTSGTYGVTNSYGYVAGTTADTGDGPGYLNMWLKFQPVAPLPIESAELKFKFWDLDLQTVNDPYGFFETFQLYGADGVAMSHKFTSGGTSSGTSNGIDWALTSSGANDPIYLRFFGDGLVSRITTSPDFWVLLKFTVPSGVPKGTNTKEYLTAKLTTTTKVPEPGALLLLGLGFAVVASSRGRRQ